MSPEAVASNLGIVFGHESKRLPIQIRPYSLCLTHHADVKEFNEQTFEDMDKIRDFLILHYCVTERRHSDFWRYCAEMDIPDSVQQKIDLFTDTARVFRKNEELFAENS